MNKNFAIIALFFLVGVLGLLIVWYESDGAHVRRVAEYAVSTGPARASEIVELKDGDHYTLTASYVTKMIAGKEQKMLAYNGMIPGPEIHVMQGAKITVDLVNKTDMPTLLHSHGIRMDNPFDGSQVQQDEILPGESFTYELKFPDVGTYWYHPHASEVYQQALGLYGAIVVAPQDPTYFPPANSAHVLFLSDLPIVGGTIAIAKDGKDHSLMGHYGNVFLINGSSDYRLTVKKEEVVRLSLVNAANARPFRLAIEGAKFKLVGGDSGAYEKASFVDTVTLGPSERAIVDVMFTKTGTYIIENATPEAKTAIGRIIVGDESASPLYTKDFALLQSNARVSSSIDPFRKYFDAAPEKKIALSVDMKGMMAGHMSSMGGMSMGGRGMRSMGMGGDDGTMGSMMAPSPDGIEWEETGGMMQMMNEMATAEEVTWKITDIATKKSNMDIDWTFAKEKPAKITIVNDAHSMHPMQHPIHFHGQRFLVLSINGVKQMNLVWKDTTLVPAGQTIEILLDPSNPGTWMAHCHIAEHLAAGMMFTFRVEQ